MTRSDVAQSSMTVPFVETESLLQSSPDQRPEYTEGRCSRLAEKLHHCEFLARVSTVTVKTSDPARDWNAIDENQGPQSPAVHLLLMRCYCSVRRLSAWRRARMANTRRSAVRQGTPVVQQAEPPNWWSNLPNPMVLLYGKNLTDAQRQQQRGGNFRAANQNFSERPLGFRMAGYLEAAPPQHFDLVVRTAGGQARVPVSNWTSGTSRPMAFMDSRPRT